MLDSFMEQLPPRARVLDFGCGVGNCAAAMQAAGHLVTCQDASPEMAAMARDLFGLVEIMSFDKLELETAFDAVWASFSLLHIPKSDLPDILARLHRTQARRPSLHRPEKGSGEERDRFGRFYAYYEEEELAGHIRNAALVRSPSCMTTLSACPALSNPASTSPRESRDDYSACSTRK